MATKNQINSNFWRIANTDPSGNIIGITVGNITTTDGLSDLGSNANVIITGGSNGQVLTTDGAGNLSWTTVSGNGGGNPFDQDLNTTNNVSFASVTTNAVVIPSIGDNEVGIVTSDLRGRLYFDSDAAFHIVTNDAWASTFKSDGTVTFGAGYTFPAVNGSDGQVLVNDGLGNLIWQDQSGGNLSEITNTDGFNTYSVSVGNTGVISMNTARGGLEFGAQPEEGAPSHLHIMRPAGQEGSSDLFFGDDYNYVKMPGLYGPGTQGVEIGSSYDNGPVSTWRFNTSGGLVFPDGTTQTTAYIESNVVTSYKGFSAHYGRMFNSEPTLSKIAIYKNTVTASSAIDSSTEDDFFQVTGLTGSDIVAMFVIMGSDSNNPTDLPTLQTFTETVIDNVLLNGGVEGEFNNIDDMRSAFYSNYNTLAANAGGLYSNFQFFKNEFNNVGGSTGNTVEGSGAAFSIVSPGAGFAYVDPPTVWLGSEGTNYKVGHKIKILGTDLGGITPDNDAIITVTGVGAGGSIVTATISGTGGDVGGGTYNNVTGTNYQVGSGFVISGVSRLSDGSIQNTGVNAWGSNYVVGDVIILPGNIFEDCASPANDITMTVTSIGGSGEPYGFSLTGTLPTDIWPLNYIQDGGNDQYDNGNYISTDLATDISYNGGNVVTSSDSEFGAGSSYVVVYQDSIWGILATSAGINSIKTDGGSGFDGDGSADTGALFGGGGGVDIGDFVFSGRTMTVMGSDEDLIIQAPDDLFLDAKDDDIFLRANDDIRFRTAYNFTTESYQWELRFNSEGVQTLYNSSEGNDYGFIRPINDGGTIGLSIESPDHTYIKSSYGAHTWTFGSDGNLTIPGSAGGVIKTVANAAIGIAAIDNGTDNPAQLLSINAATGAATTAISAYANSAYIQSNINGDIKTWAFDNTGNLTLPGNTFAVNYANGTQVSLGGGGSLYLLEAYASETYTLPGSFTEDVCRYSIVSNTVNVSSAWFDTSTYTFTPQKAGYWEITASYDIYRNAEASMVIKKNTSISASAGSFNAVAQQITKIVYLNGSTDYIQIFNYGGAALSRSQYAERSWFQARWIGE